MAVRNVSAGRVVRRKRAPRRRTMPQGNLVAETPRRGPAQRNRPREARPVSCDAAMQSAASCCHDLSPGGGLGDPGRMGARQSSGFRLRMKSTALGSGFASFWSLSLLSSTSTSSNSKAW